MKNGIRAAAGVLAGLWLSTSAGSPAQAHVSTRASGSAQREAAVATRASGTFDDFEYKQE